VPKFSSFPPQVFQENARLPRKHKKTSESKSRSNHQLLVPWKPNFAQPLAAAQGVNFGFEHAAPIPIAAHWYQGTSL
jgi:hypothetical protein